MKKSIYIVVRDRRYEGTDLIFISSSIKNAEKAFDIARGGDSISLIEVDSDNFDNINQMTSLLSIGGIVLKAKPA